MHRFPLRLQVLELSNSRGEAGDLEGHRVGPGVNIQTSEGYTVQADLTVLYRIADPLKVMQTIGPGRLFEDSAVIPRAQQDLRRALGELDAEDFYRGDKRVEKARAAQRALEAELKDKGIELENQALRGVGSENMVGLRMADALKGTRLIVLPSDGEGGMNPLDLKTLLRRFDVKE